ncbi:carboxylesterase/lipase family protein [Pararhodobacter sp.]|uniref:carboxylesterase/lipase family protein n=1 Tax=Pararhodobacter sp. TaxID=2127056 RepID=UPI002AFE3143|nr:carboxylesterase family protein [Pararhodobacter sp.]
MTDTPIATTTSGRVSGDRSGGVLRFRGIPFSGRIDGANRIRPATWPERWEGVRPAMTNAAPVPQNPPTYDEKGVAYHAYLNGPRDTVPVSEAGLTLNLWTPSLDPQAKRPIMVYIHGGGFELGSPSSKRTDGSALARNGDVVVMSAAHRLGAPGYLYLDALTDGAVKTANLGLMDLVHLLYWIAENATAFGGDPDRVTLFGESGGGIKIATLAMMPAARGLFQRGICQAGVFGPDAAEGGGSGFMTPEAATERSRLLLDALGVAPTPEAIGALDWQTITQTSARLAKPLGEGPIFWRPVLDDDTISAAAVADPAKALEVALLIGTTTFEGDFFEHTYKSAATLDRLVQRFGARGDAMAAQYKARFKPRAEAETQATGDMMFRWPSLALADHRARAGRATWLYQFDWQRSDPPFRPTHGSEGPFIFGTCDACGFCIGAEDEAQVTKLVQEIWVSFARDGVPADAATGAWARHTAGSNLAHVLRREATTDPDYFQALRSCWSA